MSTRKATIKNEQQNKEIYTAYISSQDYHAAESLQCYKKKYENLL
jgi:hypothetical protein